ncbi:MAG: hypothetical protein V4710_23665, partial [Verrucomicrobiota bacterium]
MKLEQLPGLLKEEEEKLTRKVDSVRALVEEEWIARRLSETALQSLRWALQSSGPGAVVDARSILSTARVPVDNVVLTQAFKELAALNDLVQTRRAALTNEAHKEIVRRMASVLRDSTQPAEVEEFRKTLVDLKENLQQLKSGNTLDSRTLSGNSINLLNALKRLLEAQADNQPALIGVALNQLQNFTNSTNDPGFDSEIRARLAGVTEPFIKKTEAKQNALDAALETGGSYATLSHALAEFLEALDQSAKIRSPSFTPDDTAQTVRVYRALLSVLARIEAGTADSIQQAIEEARNAIRDIRGKRAVFCEQLLTKWEKEVMGKFAASRKERFASIRERLAKIRKPSEIETVVHDLQLWNRELVRGDDENNALRQLPGMLSILASAWNSKSLVSLERLGAQEGNLGAQGSFGAELDLLRKRIERDILSHVLDAPELNAPEAAEESPELAIEKLSDTLAQKEEWRRL